MSSSTTATAFATASATATQDPLSQYFPGLVIDHSQDQLSYQASIIACSVVTWAVAAFFVAARFYTRRLLLHVWSWEDWVIVVSLVLSSMCSASIIIQAVLGLGTHIWTVPPQNAKPLAMAGWFDLLLYFMSLWATKISILMLYRRILTYPWIKLSTTILLTVIVIFGVWTLASVLTACVPLAAFWDSSIQGVCHDYRWYASTSAMHISTDFLIYVLPMPAIRTLRLRFRLKTLLYSLFAFGFLLCVISILRMVNLIVYSNVVDVTWQWTTSAYWTTVEINFAIVCACVMTLKPLIVKFFPVLEAEERLSSSDRDHRSWELSADWHKPPTIGSRSTRTPQRTQDTLVEEEEGRETREL
ncbi:hypothetical protein QBC47DRAFT_380256 [Echria macrotheca]|uniref:Rhodopsin domain-containing protein n=1 Tax=Echria macrotheca TaxID=438768 RepID=A0AAJ0F7B4_9PEZI|nr:hypothetical protein QBC47DRAFT_380256 [Echria macrotheca]